MSKEQAREVVERLAWRKTQTIAGCDVCELASLLQEIERLRGIVEQIPQLIESISKDCKIPFLNRPSMYQRGKLWRYHRVRAGNKWADADTPLEAVMQVSAEEESDG